MEELCNKFLLHSFEVLIAETNIILQLPSNGVEVKLVIGIIALELDKATQSLERSEELHTLDQQVKLTRDYVQCHAFVGYQNVVRNVLVDQVIQQDPGCVRQGLLRVLEAGLLALGGGVEVWRQDDGSKWPVSKLTETNWTVVHVDFFFVFVLQVSLEEKLFGSKLDWEHVFLRNLETIVALVSVDKVEVKVVGDAVGSHGVVTKTQA